MQSRLAIPNGNNHFPCSRAQDTGQLVPIFDHPDIEESPSTPAPRDIIHKPNDFARPALPNDVCNDGCMAAGAPNHHLLLPVRHEEFGAIKLAGFASGPRLAATLRVSAPRETVTTCAALIESLWTADGEGNQIQHSRAPRPPNHWPTASGSGIVAAMNGSANKSKAICILGVHRTDVAVVIPVFNQAQYTQSCLDSLHASGVSDSQIVVVNNASTDNTAALLSERPELNVIHNDANRGCGYAWNQGVRARQANWTILLNNDVLVPPGWLEGLLAFAEENHFDIVSPAICNGENDYDLEAFASRFMQKMARVKRSGTASGVCFMVHHPVFDSTGLFDDDPRLGGYEDDEFFRRSRQAGFRLATTGRSFLHHFGSVTQKAIKAGMHKPQGSLGDRAYYRQKYRLTWLKRHRWRLQNQFLNAWWRTRERLRFHCTLVSDRQHGAFLWR